MNYTTRVVRIQAANRMTRDFFKNASSSIDRSAHSVGLGARGAFKAAVRAPSSGAGLRFQEVGVKVRHASRGSSLCIVGAMVYNFITCCSSFVQAAAVSALGALGSIAACMADHPVGAHEGCLLDLVLMVGDDGT